MCVKSKEQRLCRNTIMREMSIDAAEAIVVSKTICPSRHADNDRERKSDGAQSTVAHAMMAEKATMQR